MTCTYRFIGTNGKQTVLKGQAAFKAFLADGGLEQLRGEAAPKFSRQQKLPELTPQDVLQPDTIAAAKDAITKYKKAEGPDPLTAEERALGESLLQPAFEAAKNNKPGFDAVLDKVAEKVGGYAKKPGIKKTQRAVTKLVTEQEWDVVSMKDLLRGTIVVSTFEEAQEAIDEIGKVYTFDRIKNRLSADMVDPDGKTLPGKPLPTGYQDILTNVVLEDGTVAEIQISTPEMVAAKNLGHEVYAFEREMPKSPVKTHMVDLQKKIYSEGLKAYKRRALASASARSPARAANFLKTSANSAASIGSPFSRTSEGLRGLGSGTQAVAERQSGATVTGTSATSKNIVPGGKDLKSNFIGTSKQSIPENEPAGKAAPKLSRKQGSVLDRIPALETAAQGVKEGTVTREQYDKLVNKLKPVTPYAEVPAPATVADMERGLTSDKVERIGAPSETLKAGDPVGLRLDIPAYANHGVWVVSVHEQEAGYSAGKSIGYESVAAVTKPTFGVVEKAALAIAGGKPKATIAVMKGDWKPITPKQASATAKMAMKNDNWVQVGMDPTRHAYFYDRENMEPVVSADEAVQIGPLVLAKNPVYGKKSDFAFSKRQELRDAADAIAKMDPEVRDDTMIGDFPGAADGYMLYEARVLLKKPSEKLKRVNENNSFELWNRYDYVANVDGELFGVTKQEDPDEPDDETKFVYSFAPLDDPFKDVTTATDQTDELFKEMRASLGAGPALSRRQTTTPEFKRFFKDSKVVDENGEPLVVYHGTNKSFNVFRPSKKFGNAYFASASTSYANALAKDVFGKTGGDNVMPLYVSLQNPRIIDFEDYNDAALESAWTDGNADGLIAVDKDGVMQVVVAFEPTQIKSATGNVGTFDATNPDIRFSKRQPRGRETEGWIFSRDEVGRFRFGAGAKAYRLAADVANNVLDKVGLKPVSEELGRAMRKMKAEVERAQRLTVDVAGKMKDLPEQERQMISDVIEGELKRGVKPPKHVLLLAASLQSIMSDQSAELVRLGMLSPDAAGRWDGKYLPRFYEQKLGDEVKAWGKAAKALLGRQKTMQGIGGSSLKSRGMWGAIPVSEIPDWEAEGWEVRDDNFDPATDTEVMIWRDYTRKERDDMGEIRDAMFRFVMGYNKSQRDIALGRLYESLSVNYASKKEKPGYVKVPDTKVEDTMARRYGKLAGMWVPAEVMDHLSAFDDSQRSEIIKMYMKGLSMWKEGKTVLNPVSHANNILSNLTMAHFAGVSYWDMGKYAGAMRDLIKNSPMVEEALDAGLFGGTFNQAELLDQMPPQLKALAGMSESRLKKGVDTTWNALSWFIRKPAATAYQAEDQFFRYLIYRDARQRGLDVEDAIDYSQQYIFTYDDLPKTARTLRDYALPFFAYTYKVVPPLVNTVLEKPWRYAAPAAALYTVNALMYAMAASLGGGDDEDWWTVIRRYVTDPEFRDKARAMEEQERENLPPWMKGYSATLATPKAIRLGMDDVTNLPVFLDVSRVFPGGDLLDAHANAGGVPLLQPITPSNPVLNTLGVMLWNKDSFFGKDIVDKTDTSAEATQKRLKWVWQQFSPAVAVGNYHWDRGMNVIANQTGQPVLGYTGISKDGLPVQPGFAAAQTVGIKIRPIDLELSAEISASEDKRIARDLETKIKQIKRLEDKGAITGKTADTEIEKLEQKKEFIKEGLTVEGEKKK